MKPILVALVILCAAVTAGTIVYLNHQKPLPVPAPVAELPPQPMEQTQPEIVVAPKPGLPRAISEDADEPAQTKFVSQPADETKPDDAIRSIQRSVDALLSAKKEKQALFEQLAKSGQLDEVIAELKQRAADHPLDPEIPTTLGEAQLNQLRALHDAGGDNDQIGILAMQADQNFNAALKIDPANWEAQFVKADSMFYWPASAGQDNNVVQGLSSLIDQQETMTPLPVFAQTYVVLGDEYQKIGQPDKAAATWQLGLAKFPNDPALIKKTGGQ